MGKRYMWSFKKSDNCQRQQKKRHFAFLHYFQSLFPFSFRRQFYPCILQSEVSQENLQNILLPYFHLQVISNIYTHHFYQISPSAPPVTYHSSFTCWLQYLPRNGRCLYVRTPIFAHRKKGKQETAKVKGDNEWEKENQPRKRRKYVNVCGKEFVCMAFAHALLHLIEVM